MNLPRSLANLNGETMPLEQVRVPALDRGFLFGDAIYEVLRIYQGKPWLINEHWQRLTRSLDAIRIRGINLDRIKQRMLDTIAAGEFQEAIVYIQITRGVAPRTHAFPVSATPTEFMYVQEFTDKYAAARRQGVAVITQPDIRWQRCDIKSTNLLGNVLAIQAAAEASCVEALLYTSDDRLTEATHSSFFGVMDGTLLATPQSPAILPGITRGFLQRLATRVGVPFREQYLHRADLKQVSELFLAGTTAEVLPIVQVDGQPIADGRVGPVSLKLLEEYQRTVAEFVKG